MLKYIEIEGEFPRFAEQIPPTAVEFVAELVKVDPAEFAKCRFDNRTAEYHRARSGRRCGQRCRSEGIEPPTDAQVERVVNSAVHRHELIFGAETALRLGPAARSALQAQLESDGTLADVKAAPGSDSGRQVLRDRNIVL